MSYQLNGREVETIEVEFEMGEGAFCTGAYFTDNDADLTDKELDQFNEAFADEIYQRAYEHMASAAYDRAKDAWKYGE